MSIGIGRGDRERGQFWVRVLRDVRHLLDTDDQIGGETAMRRVLMEHCDGNKAEVEQHLADWRRIERENS